MVDKFKLHNDKHPHFYRIALFKEGNEVIVNKRCLIILFIEVTTAHADLIKYDHIEFYALWFSAHSG